MSKTIYACMHVEKLVKLSVQQTELGGWISGVERRILVKTAVQKNLSRLMINVLCTTLY